MTRAQRIEAALRQLLPFALSVHDPKIHSQNMTNAINFARDALRPEEPVQSNNQIIEFPRAPKT